MNSNGCEVIIKKGSLKLDINKLKRVFRKGSNKEPFRLLTNRLGLTAGWIGFENKLGKSIY